MSKCKCGFEDELPDEENWRNNIACQIVGCKNCKNFNGTVYFMQNMLKGIALYAKKEIEYMDNQSKEQEQNEKVY